MARHALEVWEENAPGPELEACGQRTLEKSGERVDSGHASPLTKGFFGAPGVVATRWGNARRLSERSTE